MYTLNCRQKKTHQNPNKKIDEKDVASHLKDELVITRKQVNGKLAELKIAQQCFDGTREKCEGMEQLLHEVAPYWKTDGKLPTDPYYNCISTTRESRDNDNKIVNSAFINTALMLTPMGVLGASKMLYQSGKLIKAASTVAKVKTSALITGVTADVTISEIETAKIYDQCRKKLETLAGLQQSAPSCQVQEMKVTLASDVNKCRQQIIASGLSILSGGVGIGLTKMAMIPTKSTDDEIKYIMSEYVAGLKNPSDRQRAILDLNSRLSKLAKNKEYTPEEITSALKVYLKKCKD